MEKKYDLIMDKIKVTDEMHDRILNNIKNMDIEHHPKVKRFPAYKKYLSLTACIVFLLAGAFVLSNMNNHTSEIQVTPEIIEYSSAVELSKNVNFTVSDITNLPFEVNTSSYRAYWHELAEIVYSGDEQTAVFRKSIGNEDISGDFNSYDTIGKITIDTNTITLKGNAGEYNLALWSEGKFSYSLQLSFSIPETDWVNIISGID